MNKNKTTILLKVTGTSLLNKQKTGPDATLMRSLMHQIKQLSTTHWFGIVIGGGNFFRGSQHGKTLGLTPSTGHQVGMLATALNGLIIQDIGAQEGVALHVLSAFSCPALAESICPEKIARARAQAQGVVFVGGTGNPFFTTDTAAVVRALQIDALQLWKATDVDGVYDRDPHVDLAAQKIDRLSYKRAILDNFGIMDKTAFALAQEHGVPIRVFNIHKPNTLVHAAQDADYGSLIST